MFATEVHKKSFIDQLENTVDQFRNENPRYKNLIEFKHRKGEGRKARDLYYWLIEVRGIQGSALEIIRIEPLLEMEFNLVKGVTIGDQVFIRLPIRAKEIDSYITEIIELIRALCSGQLGIATYKGVREGAGMMDQALCVRNGNTCKVYTLWGEDSQVDLLVFASELDSDAYPITTRIGRRKETGYHEYIEATDFVELETPSTSHTIQLPKGLPLKPDRQQIDNIIDTDYMISD